MPLWDAITREATEADRAMVALDRVYAWAQGNEFSFDGREKTNQHTGDITLPKGEWFGAWSRNDHWTFIAFLEPKIRRFLDDEGFDTDAIFRTWLDRGWLEVGVDNGRKGRVSKPVRIGGGVVRAIVVKRGPLDTVGG